MKPLPKHLRPRHRYLAVQIETWPDADLDRQAVQGSLWMALRALHGDRGSADADPTVVRFDHEHGTGHAIVRVRRDAVALARGAIACIDRIEGDPVGIRIDGVAGTIRACEEKYIGEDPIETAERTVVFGDAEMTAVIRGDRVDLGERDARTGATLLDLESE